MTFDMAKQVCKLIEEERGLKRILNERPTDEASPEGAEATAEGSVSSRLSAAALKKELEAREENMQAGGQGSGPTDQWRVYQHVISQLETGTPMRLMVQASAGTGTLAAIHLSSFKI